MSSFTIFKDNEGKMPVLRSGTFQQNVGRMPNSHRCYYVEYLNDIPVKWNLHPGQQDSKGWKAYSCALCEYQYVDQGTKG